MNDDLEKTDFSDITIIIPTHNRPSLLKRSLKYYSEYKINIIVVDSSEVNLNCKNNKYLQYFYCPNLSYNEKLLLGSQNIKTKYTTICADDDFFSLNGLLIGLEFLEKNNDYGSVQGNTIIFYRYFKFFIFCKENNTHLNNFSRDNKNIKNRIFEKFLKQNLLYSLTRSKIFIETCRIACKFEEISIFEVTDSIVKSIMAKQKTLNIFWNARDMKRYTFYTSSKKNSKNLILEDFSKFIQTKKGNNYIKNLTTMFSKFIFEKNLNVEEFRKLLIKNFKAKKKISYKNIHNKFFKRFRIFDIRFFIYTIIYKFKRNTTYDYPWTSDHSKNDWIKMKKIIFLKL